MKSTRNPLGRLLVLLLPSLLLVSPATAEQPPEVNGIAAKVNGRVITKNKVAMLNRMTQDSYRPFAQDKLLADAIRAREANKK